MNELIFLFQSLTITAATLLALRLGKEAIVSLMALLCVLSNFFVLKQIGLFGLQATAADSFSVGTILSLQLIQEYFGKKISQKAIWICFFSTLVYMVASQIHLLYIPTTADIHHHHFAALFQFVPRIVIASLLVYLFVLQLDRYLYGKLQQRFGKTYLFARNIGLLAFILLVDTILFSFFGLYGIVNNVMHVIVVSYTIKLGATVLASPIVLLSKKMRPIRNTGE